MIKILLFLSLSASAGITIQHKNDAIIVMDQIKPQVLRVGIKCAGDICTIDWEQKPGVSVVFTDRRAIKKALWDELEALDVKLEAGTITNAELMRITKISIKLAKLYRSD